MPAAAPGLARRIGLFDATMIVMGGIVGSGIFVTPADVARSAGSPALILGAWVVGGVAALLGAFVYAELSSARPEVGGQYAYLREAVHPLAAFLYGWALLLVIQTGGMAATAIAFARYFRELLPLPLGEAALAAAAVAALTIVNCLGVRAGSAAQSVLMVLKICALAALIGAGLLYAGAVPSSSGAKASAGGFGAALVPVLFAYGGWQTACFVAGEMKEPRRDLPRALLLGVVGVAVLYTSVNFVCVRGLGVAGLAATDTPASAIMRIALGRPGAIAIALGIAISTLGFLSQSVLTAPRVYFAMAEDGIFFRQLAWVHPATRVPVFAIVLQSVWTMLILFSGSYGQILDYVTAMDWIFFGLTASCLFVLRRREQAAVQFRMPLHPISTALFCIVCWSVVANTIYRYPGNTLIGMAILISGVPVYYIWKRISQT